MLTVACDASIQTLAPPELPKLKTTGCDPIDSRSLPLLKLLPPRTVGVQTLPRSIWTVSTGCGPGPLQVPPLRTLRSVTGGTPSVVPSVFGTLRSSVSGNSPAVAAACAPAAAAPLPARAPVPEATPRKSPTSARCVKGFVKGAPSPLDSDEALRRNSDETLRRNSDETLRRNSDDAATAAQPTPAISSKSPARGQRGAGGAGGGATASGDVDDDDDELDPSRHRPTPKAKAPSSACRLPSSSTVAPGTTHEPISAHKPPSRPPLRPSPTPRSPPVHSVPSAVRLPQLEEPDQAWFVIFRNARATFREGVLVPEEEDARSKGGGGGGRTPRTPRTSSRGATPPRSAPETAPLIDASKERPGTGTWRRRGIGTLEPRQFAPFPSIVHFHVRVHSTPDWEAEAATVPMQTATSYYDEWPTARLMLDAKHLVGMHGGLSLAPSKFPDLEIVVRHHDVLNPTLQETVHPFNLSSLRGLGATEGRLVVPVCTQPRILWRDEDPYDVESLFDALGPFRREPGAVREAVCRRCPRQQYYHGAQLDCVAGARFDTLMRQLYVYITQLEEPYQTRKPLSEREEHEARLIIAELSSFARFVKPLCGVLRPLVPAGWTDWQVAGECQECGDAVSTKWRGLQCHAGSHRLCWRCIGASISWKESRIRAFSEIPLEMRDRDDDAPSA